MEETIASLEEKREHLYESLINLGDFRRGTISVLYRKCGKKNLKHLYLSLKCCIYEQF